MHLTAQRKLYRANSYSARNTPPHPTHSLEAVAPVAASRLWLFLCNCLCRLGEERAPPARRDPQGGDGHNRRPLRGAHWKQPEAGEHAANGPLAQCCPAADASDSPAASLLPVLPERANGGMCLFVMWTERGRGHAHVLPQRDGRFDCAAPPMPGTACQLPQCVPITMLANLALDRTLATPRVGAKGQEPLLF